MTVSEWSKCSFGPDGSHSQAWFLTSRWLMGMAVTLVADIHILATLLHPLPRLSAQAEPNLLITLIEIDCSLALRSSGGCRVREAEAGNPARNSPPGESSDHTPLAIDTLMPPV